MLKDLTKLPSGSFEFLTLLCFVSFFSLGETFLNFVQLFSPTFHLKSGGGEANETGHFQLLIARVDDSSV